MAPSPDEYEWSGLDFPRDGLDYHWPVLPDPEDAFIFKQAVIISGCNRKEFQMDCCLSQLFEGLSTVKKVLRNIVCDISNLDLAAFAYRQLADLVRYAHEQMAHLLPPWVRAVPLRIIQTVVFRLESARRRFIRLRRIPVQHAYHRKGKTVPAIDKYMDQTPVPARTLWDLSWTTRHWSSERYLDSLNPCYTSLRRSSSWQRYQDNSYEDVVVWPSGDDSLCLACVRRSVVDRRPRCRLWGGIGGVEFVRLPRDDIGPELNCIHHDCPSSRRFVEAEFGLGRIDMPQPCFWDLGRPEPPEAPVRPWYEHRPRTGVKLHSSDKGPEDGDPRTQVPHAGRWPTRLPHRAQKPRRRRRRRTAPLPPRKVLQHDGTRWVAGYLDGW